MRTYTCFSEEDVDAKVKELRQNGIDLFDIYVFRYWGNDGVYHREVGVRMKENMD